MGDTVQLHDLTFRPFLNREEIDNRVRQMAEELYRDLKEETPLFLAVLNGSYVFAADLLRHYPGDCEISFVKLASYQGVSSTGEINELIGLNTSLEGRCVVIVEDIIDSGLTMKNLLRRVREANPADIKLVSLLVKPEELSVPLHIDQTGFEIPSLFVVGYGMDYNELGRNLPGIYQLITN